MAVRKPDPKQLALWAIGGATLAASTFFVTFLPKWRLDCITFRCTVLLLPFILGVSVWFFADRRLRRGRANGLWSPAELAPVRALLTKPVLIWTASGFVVCAIAALAFTKHSGALFYITTLPLNAIGSMRRLLMPPLEPTASAFLTWHNAKPLHSDHWGEASRHSNHALPS